jgi:hypothetical protein
LDFGIVKSPSVTTLNMGESTVGSEGLEPPYPHELPGSPPPSPLIQIPYIGEEQEEEKREEEGNQREERGERS